MFRSHFRKNSSSNGSALIGQDINYDDDLDINIRNEKIEIADSFTYLGCTVTKDQRHETEISVRLAKTSKACSMLRYAI